MKSKSLFLFGALALTTMSFTPKATEYKVDNSQSKVTWIGRKVTGEHTGTINLASGKLLTDGKQLTGGTFQIDMRSIKDVDLTDAEWNQKLVGHLKSEDFFNTEKYPTSTLVITKIASGGKDQYTVNGNLTIKGISKPIEFPATVQNNGKQLKAKAQIKVDRTQYDIRYGSKSFFDSLGDKAIDNEFELNVELTAVK